MKRNHDTTVELPTDEQLKPDDGEVFKPYNGIKGREGFYLVSNFGRVWSCKRSVGIVDSLGRKSHRVTHGTFIKYLFDSRGRKMVALGGCSSEPYLKLLHCVVGELFVKKPKDFKRRFYVLNRKDGSYENCRADNLEWIENSKLRRNSDTFKVAVVAERVNLKRGEKPIRLEFDSVKRCAEHFGASKQCIHISMKRGYAFKHRWRITRVSDETLSDWVEKRGGRKYKW